MKERIFKLTKLQRDFCCHGPCNPRESNNRSISFLKLLWSAYFQDPNSTKHTMKVLPAIAAAAYLTGLVSPSAIELSWHNLTITAPQYGRYLLRTESEEPFFWKADTAWELTHRLNKTSIDFYLKTRAEKGYNVVLSVVISAYNGTTRLNFYGDLPFNNSDTTQPNE
ncbi:unnamed protein product [Phytophthora fragariaefolia]|uniref:Unnamed protein product n=1 Tax=Phytophthora fragariaefolia TaxID=1490495 RepID=A0A9W6Y6P8_9STRA|nr:unnamed protein product [Phytophthora fragariaefolia]